MSFDEEIKRATRTWFDEIFSKIPEDHEIHNEKPQTWDRFWNGHTEKGRRGEETQIKGLKQKIDQQLHVISHPGYPVLRAGSALLRGQRTLVLAVDWQRNLRFCTGGYIQDWLPPFANCDRSEKGKAVFYDIVGASKEEYRRFNNSMYEALRGELKRYKVELSDFDPPLEIDRRHKNLHILKAYDLICEVNEKALDEFLFHLNPEVFEAAQVAQIFNPAFYNWLNGNQVHGNDVRGVELTCSTDETLAYKRCKFVRENPPLGYFIGLILNQDKGHTSFSKMIEEEREYDDLQHYDVVNVCNALGQEVDNIDPIIQNPQFWRGHEESLRIFCEVLWPDPHRDLSIALDNVYLALRVQEHQRVQLPQPIPGGIL